MRRGSHIVTLFVLVVGLINIAIGFALAIFLEAPSSRDTATSAESAPLAEQESSASDDPSLQEDAVDVPVEVDRQRLAGEIVAEYIRGLDEYDGQIKAIGDRLAAAASGNGDESSAEICTEIAQLTKVWLDNQEKSVDRARQSRDVLGELDHITDQIEDACEDLSALASSLLAVATAGFSPPPDGAFQAVMESLEELRDAIERERSLLGLINFVDPPVSGAVS